MAAWRDGRQVVRLRRPARQDRRAEGRQAHQLPSRATRSSSTRSRCTTATTGKVLAELPLPRPRGVAVQGRACSTPCTPTGEGFAVSAVQLGAGRCRKATGSSAFAVPQAIKPFDLEVDSHGRFYLSDREGEQRLSARRRGQGAAHLRPARRAEAGRVRPADVHGAGQAGDVDGRRGERPAARRRERPGRTASASGAPTASCCASSSRCRPRPTTATPSTRSTPSTFTSPASRAG